VLIITSTSLALPLPIPSSIAGAMSLARSTLGTSSPYSGWSSRTHRLNTEFAAPGMEKWQTLIGGIDAGETRAGRRRVS
jgi:hypothetical protein